MVVVPRVYLSMGYIRICGPVGRVLIPDHTRWGQIGIGAAFHFHRMLKSNSIYVLLLNWVVRAPSMQISISGRVGKCFRSATSGRVSCVH